jgi:uncharacterized protein (DUF433 family)
MAQTRRRDDVHDRELIERYIDPEWDRYPSGRADARLKDYGVPVWALIGQLRATGNDPDRVAREYHIPREAMDGALAYYRQNKKYIDARLLLNSA